MDKLIQEKRANVRIQIRKEQLENIFKQKRIISNNEQLNTNLTIIHEELSQNLENSAQKLVQKQQLINELKNSNDHLATLILANLCASESPTTISFLIEQYEIHTYFMQKIQDNISIQNHQIVFKCFGGLANLLYSEPKLLQKVKPYFFKSNILKYIYIESFNIGKDNIDSMQLILRLLIGLLFNADEILRKNIDKSQLIQICQEVFLWLNYNQKECFFVISLSTKICPQLLEIVNQEIYEHILDILERSECQFQQQAIIGTLDDLFISSDQTLVVSYLDNQRLLNILKNLLTNNQCTLNILYFLLNRVVFTHQSIQEFVIQFYEDLIECLNQNNKIINIERIFKILNELYENEMLNTEQKQQVFQESFVTLKYLYEQFQETQCIEIVQFAFTLSIHNGYKMNHEQKLLIKKLQQSQNEELADVAFTLYNNKK